MNKKQIYYLLFRYVFLIVIALPNLFLFYYFFTPLTIYPVAFILNLFYRAALLDNNVIFFQGGYVSIIPACIAGAAYYLLLILNLTTPIEKEKRIKSLIFLFFSFLVLNILRIVIFASLILKGYQYFDLAHKTFWYFGSTILLILIWFTNIKIFKIKAIPVFTDVKNLQSKTGGMKMPRSVWFLSTARIP